MQENRIHGFKLEIVEDATSPDLAGGIWKAQHVCVEESPDWLDSKMNLRGEKAERAIIRHELGESGKRGHYSVLRFGFVSMMCVGFPHSTAMQLRTHYSSGLSMLVTSLRYTGDRFMHCVDGLIRTEDVFYLRPVGQYFDREGSKYEYTEERRKADLVFTKQSCELYTQKVLQDCPKEMARSILCHDIRQPFIIAGDLRSWFHMLDNRTKKNAQLECQIFSQMAIEELRTKIPILMDWYESNRKEKAILAP